VRRLRFPVRLALGRFRPPRVVLDGCSEAVLVVLLSALGPILLVVVLLRKVVGKSQSGDGKSQDEEDESDGLHHDELGEIR